MTSSLSSLLEQSSIEDHEEVIKASNAALKESKNNVRAQHVKAIALLQLNRFDDAIRLFDEGGEKLKSEAQLEYAYALYKIGELEKAEQTAGRLESRGAKHLQAQASYRLENFATAKNLYQQLFKSPQEEENDVRINLNATYAQLLWKREGSSVTKTKADREDLETFEAAYNAACISIARGELSQAEILLRRAKDLCNASEELTTEQKQEELLSIGVQQLYVLNALGKTDEGEALIASVSIESIPDLSTRKVAQTNKLTSARKSTNPYLAQRLLSTSTTLPVSDKLFEFQKLIAEQNRIAIDLACSKFDGVARSTQKVLAAEPSASTSPRINNVSCANAAAHAQNQLGKLGLKEILPLLEKRPNDVGLVATVVQLYLLTQNQGAAIQVVEKLLKHLEDSKNAAEQEVRFSPGLVAMIVSLYNLEGRNSHIRTELSKAASYWKHKSTSTGLLRSAGLSLLESGSNEDLKAASQVFEDLRNANPNDPFAKAGYVASHASIEPSKASNEANALTTVERLTAGIDVAVLEKAAIPRTGASTSTLLKRKRASESVSKPKKKRVRKSKAPKNVDPDKKPDPERWLPLRDRSTYKPKGKKGKQKQAALTQGASDKAADGAGAGTEQAKSTVVTGSSSGGGKSKKKNKKK